MLKTDNIVSLFAVSGCCNHIRKTIASHNSIEPEILLMYVFNENERKKQTKKKEKTMNESHYQTDKNKKKKE